MPIWLDLKQQHGRLTATTGSRHLLAAHRPPCHFFLPQWKLWVRESERMSGTGIGGIGVWRGASGEECSERSYWLGSAMEKKQLVLSETARRRSAVFGKQHLFSANNHLAGREKEKRERPWHQISCVSEDPQSRRLQKTFAIRRREDQKKKKTEKEKKKSTRRTERQWSPAAPPGKHLPAPPHLLLEKYTIAHFDLATRLSSPDHQIPHLDIRKSVYLPSGSFIPGDASVFYANSRTHAHTQSAHTHRHVSRASSLVANWSGLSLGTNSGENKSTAHLF